MLAWVSSITCNDRNNSAQTLNTIVSIIYFGVLVLSIFLAIRDMNSLDTTASKVWLFIFAIFAPELYVIIHGLSSSSLGMPFFSESPVEIPLASRGGGSIASSLFPTPKATATPMAEHLKNATQSNIQAHSERAASDVLSNLESSL